MGSSSGRCVPEDCVRLIGDPSPTADAAFQLPADTLRQLFSYASSWTKMHVLALVCKRWRLLAIQTITVVCAPRSGIPWRVNARLLPLMPSLTELELGKLTTNALLTVLPTTLTQLRILNWTEYEDTTYRVLNLPCIRSVVVARLPFPLLTATTLTSLDLSSITTITPTHWAIRLPLLTSVTVNVAKEHAPDPGLWKFLCYHRHQLVSLSVRALTPCDNFLLQLKDELENGGFTSLTRLSIRDNSHASSRPYHAVIWPAALVPLAPYLTEVGIRASLWSNHALSMSLDVIVNRNRSPRLTSFLLEDLQHTNVSAFLSSISEPLFTELSITPASSGNFKLLKPRNLVNLKALYVEIRDLPLVDEPFFPLLTSVTRLSFDARASPKLSLALLQTLLRSLPSVVDLQLRVFFCTPTISDVPPMYAMGEERSTEAVQQEAKELAVMKQQARTANDVTRPPDDSIWVFLTWVTRMTMMQTIELQVICATELWVKTLREYIRQHQWCHIHLIANRTLP